MVQISSALRLAARPEGGAIDIGDSLRVAWSDPGVAPGRGGVLAEFMPGRIARIKLSLAAVRGGVRLHVAPSGPAEAPLLACRLILELADGGGVRSPALGLRVPGEGGAGTPLSLRARTWHELTGLFLLPPAAAGAEAELVLELPTPAVLNLAAVEAVRLPATPSAAAAATLRGGATLALRPWQLRPLPREEVSARAARPAVLSAGAALRGRRVEGHVIALTQPGRVVLAAGGAQMAVPLGRPAVLEACTLDNGYGFAADLSGLLREGSGASAIVCRISDESGEIVAELPLGPAQRHAAAAAAKADPTAPRAGPTEDARASRSGARPAPASDARAKLKLCEALLASGRHEALLAASSGSTAWSVRGLRLKALRSLGRHDEAAALARAMLKDKPGNRDAQLQLIRTLRDAGRTAEALDAARAAAQTLAGDAEVLGLAQALEARLSPAPVRAVAPVPQPAAAPADAAAAEAEARQMREAARAILAQDRATAAKAPATAAPARAPAAPAPETSKAARAAVPQAAGPMPDTGARAVDPDDTLPHPIIYIVTPSFNAVQTIDRTIQSVLSQAGDFRLRYHVQDGGSTDGTPERLARWQDALTSGRYPLHNRGVRFSYASEPDSGMYEAVIRGFETLGATKDSFMAWINADDVLLTGTCAFVAAVQQQFGRDRVSWLGGSVAVMRDDLIISTHDRPMSREVLRHGLADGTHWPFVQQDGTFFRKWLWDAARPRESILPMRLAGDWNLWRLFAQNASLVQAPMPLGAFRLRDGQLSSVHRERYLAEIEVIVPAAERRQRLRELVEEGMVLRRKIRGKYPGIELSLYEDNAYPTASAAYRAVFGNEPPAPRQAYKAGERLLATGKPRRRSDEQMQQHLHHVSHGAAVSVFDHGWQFPAVTEQHAANRLKTLLAAETGGHYVAYPWANLIDKLNASARDIDAWLASFWEFCRSLPVGRPRVTVCQHIHARRFVHLFQEAGISTVFWSHATREDVEQPDGRPDAVRFLPFPLYPVQVPQALPEAAPEADGRARPYLFSFVGARANSHYLTRARTWILDLLAEDRRGLILGRDGWHYQKVVYDLQIKQTARAGTPDALMDSAAAGQFREALVNSIFSLCPSGTGPNSIRLWESLGAGAIPVILADTWAPPGDRRLWEAAAVFCPETPEDIRALPDRLAAIAADPARLAAMRHAMRQLWLLYGPPTFVTDVLAALLERSAPPSAAPSGPATDPATARRLLLGWSARLLLEPAETLAALGADPGAAAALEAASAQLADTELPGHLRAVLSFARRTAGPLPAPARLRQTSPKVALIGRHAHRTPLSYAPIRRMIGDRLAFVQDPAQAEVVVAGFNIAFREEFETLKPLLEAPNPPRLAVMSEEPLWDVTWSGPFTGRDGVIRVNGSEIRYVFVGHETSDIFAFRRIPYFVLTDDRFPVRYAALMARFAGLAPAALVERWRSAPVPAAFFAEKRLGEAYAGSFPDRDVTRLSAYRSEVAELCRAPGTLRVGQGWGTPIRRQDLPDWHLDKLAQLDGRVRAIAAYENVHMRHYISEKVFDAFAAGGVPVVWAGPGHRLTELVPVEALLNTHGLDPAAAAERIAALTPDAALAEAWLAACARLAGLFGDPRAVTAERRRVADAAVAEILVLA